MPYTAEMITEVMTPNSMVAMGVSSLALAAGVGRGASKSVTRVPPNTAGMWEHHGRPYARKDSWRRRFLGMGDDCLFLGYYIGIGPGMKKGDLYGDAEPGSHGHLPFVRSISDIGTHVRFADLVENTLDNTERQHNLGGNVAWKVVDKYDKDGNEIAYERDGKPVPYKQMLNDAIYKARASAEGEKTTSAEHALHTMVVRTSWTGLKEVMMQRDDSHSMLSDDAFPLLQEAVGHKLLDYGVELVGLNLGDTHLTDLIPRAIRGVVSGDEALATGTEGVVLEFGGKRLRVAPEPPATT